MVRRLSPKPDVRFDVRIFYPSSSDFSLSHAPFEIAVAFSLNENHLASIRSFIDRGYGVGIRSVARVPDAVRAAVNRIAATQGGAYEPWLSRLIFENVVPVFTDDELLDAQDAGANLYQDIRAIQEAAPTMIRSMLADIESQGVSDAHLAEVARLNEALAPLSAAYLHHRIHADDANPPSAWKARAVRAALIVGPCAFLMSRWSPGLGMVVAVLGEQAWQGIVRWRTLRRAGHTRRWRIRTLFPYATLILPVCWLAWISANLVASGSLFFAGFIFGCSAIAYPLLRLADEWTDLRARLHALVAMGKFPTDLRASLSGLIMREWLLRPSRLATFVALLSFPFSLGFLVWILPPLFSYAWTFSFAPVAIDGLIAFGLWVRRRADRQWFHFAIRRRLSATGL